MEAAEVRDENEPIRAALRRSTNSDHLALHRLPHFVALQSGDLSLAGYHDLMRRLHRFHSTFEQATSGCLSRHAESLAGYVQPRRAILVANDLAAMGDPMQGHDPIRLSRPRSAAELAGMLYVVDGSMLGAATLYPRAHKIAGPDCSSYWHWCRTKGVRLWASLCDVLPAVAAGNAEREAMVVSARKTFRAFAESFEDAVAATGNT